MLVLSHVFLWVFLLVLLFDKVVSINFIFGICLVDPILNINRSFNSHVHFKILGVDFILIQSHDGRR